MASGAEAGTLQIFVGGRAGTYQRARPLLEAMGDPERILHVGPHGAGYTVKLMINLLWFAQLTATAEVLSVGTAAGVDLAVLHRCLLASPAASHFLERDVLPVCTAATTTSRSRWRWPARISASRSTWPGRPACRPR